MSDFEEVNQIILDESRNALSDWYIDESVAKFSFPNCDVSYNISSFKWTINGKRAKKNEIESLFGSDICTIEKLVGMLIRASGLKNTAKELEILKKEVQMLKFCTYAPPSNEFSVPKQIAHLRLEQLPYRSSGIYFLVKGSCIVYVGQTTNIMNRIAGHKDKDFDEVLFMRMPAKTMSSVEKEWIQYLKPEYNKDYNY